MKLLWVDDEIEELDSHLLFLEAEGVDVKTATSAQEGLDVLSKQSFDLILLDYMMPGMNGVEALREVKRRAPNVPVALVTMQTDRSVIEEAVAREAFDYLIKPVQPTQVLALIKRAEASELKRQLAGKDLAQAYRQLMQLPDDWEGWKEKARLLSDTYQEMGDAERVSVRSEIASQNGEFARWIERNYAGLIADGEAVTSANLLKKKLFPLLDDEKKVALFVFDCFRQEQFLPLLRSLPADIHVERDSYLGLLPSATPYARNAIFAGMLPADIHRRHPGWLEDNRHEIELLDEYLQDAGYSWVNHSLLKLNYLKDLKDFTPSSETLQCVVVNFIDLIFHLRQEVDALRALGEGSDSLLRWAGFIFEEGGVRDHVVKLVREGYTVMLTTDHGWVIGEEPVIVQGGGELSRGLRYKFGDSLRITDGDALLVRELSDWGLPAVQGKKRLAMAAGYGFFVYPSDPHRFEKTYKGGAYHGGVSLEESIVPLVTVSPG